MVIGDRLKSIREQKSLSQGDVEKRTGLLRCYISRVENGHTVPAVETLEKFARALEIPMYQLFYDGDEPPALPDVPKRKKRMTFHGELPEKMGAFSRDSAASLVASIKPIGVYCCPWQSRWRNEPTRTIRPDRQIHRVTSQDRRDIGAEVQCYTRGSASDSKPGPGERDIPIYS